MNVDVLHDLRGMRSYDNGQIRLCASIYFNSSYFF